MTDDRSARQRAGWEAQRADAMADAAERVRFQESLAAKLLNALLIAHGGGIVALFTFVGGLMARADAPIQLRPGAIWAGFACFVGGLTLALAAYICAFLSQHHFYMQAVEEAKRAERALFMDMPQIDRTAERMSNAAGYRHYHRGLAAIGLSVTLFLAGGGLALAGLLPR